MRRPRIAGPALLLGILLVGGCDTEAAQLAKEITDAKGDCTQEKLKAGDEACVAMMEKYAAIGTSAIETYIGAVKSMDQALQRMPPATFDTAGFGHALTPARADTGGLAPSGFSASRGSATRYGLDGGSRWGSTDPADPRYAEPGYTDPRYADPRDPAYRAPGKSGRGYSDPGYPPSGYGDPGSGDPRYGDSRYADPRYADPRYGDPRSSASGYADPRYPEPRSGAARGGSSGYPDRYDPSGGNPREDYGVSESGRYAPRAPATPPGRGLLLPPEQRLQRPWLRPEEPADPYRGGARRTPRAADPRARRPSDYLPFDSLSADSPGRDGTPRDREWRSDGY